MTVSWSLTITSPCRIATTMGSADDHKAAVTKVLAAAQEALADVQIAMCAAALLSNVASLLFFYVPGS